MNCPFCHKDIEFIDVETSATAELKEDEIINFIIDNEWLVYSCPECTEDLGAENAHEAIQICTPGTPQYIALTEGKHAN